MRRIIPYVLAGVASAATAGCSSSYGTGNNSTAPPPPPASANAVDIRDDYFNPNSATVTAGTTVTWTWRGATGHNVTFEDGVGSSDTQNSGTHNRTFQNPGTYRYRCTIHSTAFGSGMSGEIVVQ